MKNFIKSAKVPNGAHHRKNRLTALAVTSISPETSAITMTACARANGKRAGSVSVRKRAGKLIAAAGGGWPWWLLASTGTDGTA